MWISEVKLMSDSKASTYEIGFHNTDVEAKQALPAPWTEKKQGRRALVSATLLDGRTEEETSIDDVPVEYLLWYSGHGRFEHYISSDRDSERSFSWFPEFISTMLCFVEIVGDVEEWCEHYNEMEMLYHYRDFKRAFEAKDGTAAEVVLEICRIFGITKVDLTRALSASIETDQL